MSTVQEKRQFVSWFTKNKWDTQLQRNYSTMYEKKNKSKLCQYSDKKSIETENVSQKTEIEYHVDVFPANNVDSF